MPLVHFSEQKDITKTEKDKLTFHWSLLLKDV